MEYRYRRINYYLRLRELAEKKAADNFGFALQQDGFKAARFQLFKNKVDFAHAEIQGDFVKVEALQKEKMEIEDRIKKILQTINLTLDDLQPKYLCKECRDTGYTPEGRFCNCYLDSLSNKR